MPRKPSSPRKQAPTGDTTRTARANALLERLAEAKGKRVVVDFYAAERAALDALIADKYAPNQSEVVRQAVIEVAAARQARKRKKA